MQICLILGSFMHANGHWKTRQTSSFIYRFQRIFKRCFCTEGRVWLKTTVKLTIIMTMLLIGKFTDTSLSLRNSESAFSCCGLSFWTSNVEHCQKIIQIIRVGQAIRTTTRFCGSDITRQHYHPLLSDVSLPESLSERKRRLKFRLCHFTPMVSSSVSSSKDWNLLESVMFNSSHLLVSFRRKVLYPKHWFVLSVQFLLRLSFNRRQQGDGGLKPHLSLAWHTHLEEFFEISSHVINLIDQSNSSCFLI